MKKKKNTKPRIHGFVIIFILILVICNLYSSNTWGREIEEKKGEERMWLLKK